MRQPIQLCVAIQTIVLLVCLILLVPTVQVSATKLPLLPPQQPRQTFSLDLSVGLVEDESCENELAPSSLSLQQRQQQQRIDYVRNILQQRYDYVISKRRAMDFARWIQKELGGNTVVFSMHGVNDVVDLSPLRHLHVHSYQQQQQHAHEQQQTTIASTTRATNTNHETLNDENSVFHTAVDDANPFSPNMMNLDLPSPPPPNPSASSLSPSPNDNNKNKDNHNVLNVLDSHGPPSLFQLFLRACRLYIHFFPVISTTWIAICLPSFRMNTWYRWMASCLASGGPAFIKWGQWASTRNDMFPDALCDALSQLHNSAPEHDWSITQATLEASLGIPPNTLLQVFESVDPKPLASGSIAQIHKAVLPPPRSIATSTASATFLSPSHRRHHKTINNRHNNNHHHSNNQNPPPALEFPSAPRTVAIKVRHPRVAKLIDMDFRIMTIMARVLLDWIPAFSWLHIRETVEQFSHTMAAQAHLHVEAYHLEIFSYNFRAWPQVRFPRPMFANEAVIVETFEPGLIVTDLLDKYDAAATSGAETIEVEQAAAVINSIPTVDSAIAWNANNITLPPIGHQIETLQNHSLFAIKNGGVDDNQEHDIPEGIFHTAASVDETTESKGYRVMPIETVQFLVTTGLSVYLKMLLVDNVMHADLHPGNIMLDVRMPSHKGKHPDMGETGATPDLLLPNVESKGSSFQKPDISIALVDAGMVARLTQEESNNFIGLLSSVGEGDGNKAAEAALRFSLENTLSQQEQQAFKQDMIELFSKRCKGYGTNVDVGLVLRGVLGLIRKHRVRIDANYATLAVNCLCVESLARRVCPEYNLLDAAKPLLQKYSSIRFEPNGAPKPASPKQDMMLKLWMPIMNVKKDLADRAFFRRYAKHLAEMKMQTKPVLQVANTS